MDNTAFCEPAANFRVDLKVQSEKQTQSKQTQSEHEFRSLHWSLFKWKLTVNLKHRPSWIQCSPHKTWVYSWPCTLTSSDLTNGRMAVSNQASESHYSLLLVSSHKPPSAANHKFLIFQKNTVHNSESLGSLTSYKIANEDERRIQAHNLNPFSTHHTNGLS